MSKQVVFLEVQITFRASASISDAASKRARRRLAGRTFARELKRWLKERLQEHPDLRTFRVDVST